MKFLYILAGLFGTFVNCYNKHDKFVEKISNIGSTHEVRNNYSICTNDCIVFYDQRSIVLMSHHTLTI